MFRHWVKVEKYVPMIIESISTASRRLSGVHRGFHNHNTNNETKHEPNASVCLYSTNTVNCTNAILTSYNSEEAKPSQAKETQFAFGNEHGTAPT